MLEHQSSPVLVTASRTSYRYHTTSVTGFVQQLVRYLSHGYVFYVAGCIPATKSVTAVDKKILTSYEIALTTRQRQRRQQQGLAKLQYLRFERNFLMLATHGTHDWFTAERRSIRDVRRAPISFHGYSISLQQGHYQRRTALDQPVVVDDKMRVRVQIGRTAFRELKRQLLADARQRTASQLARQFYHLEYEPYAPIRKQLLALHKKVNGQRRQMGYQEVPLTALRLRRQIVKPFEAVAVDDAIPAVVPRPRFF